MKRSASDCRLTACINDTSHTREPQHLHFCLTPPHSDAEYATTVFIWLLGEPTYDLTKIIGNILAHSFFMRRCTPVECFRVHNVKPTEKEPSVDPRGCPDEQRKHQVSHGRVSSTDIHNSYDNAWRKNTITWRPGKRLRV